LIPSFLTFLATAFNTSSSEPVIPILTVFSFAELAEELLPQPLARTN
jgi:hypothetical protein